MRGYVDSQDTSPENQEGTDLSNQEGKSNQEDLSNEEDIFKQNEIKSTDQEEDTDTLLEDQGQSQIPSLTSLGEEDDLNLQASSDPIDLKGAVTSVVIAKVNGEDYDATKTYPRGSTIEFSLNYAFSENNKPSTDGKHTSTYTIPSGLKVADKSGDIDGGTYTAGAGTYEIKNNVVTFTYTDGFLEAHPDQISGTFTFTGTLDGSLTDNKDSATINFEGNGTTIPITINFEAGKVTGNKSYVLNSDGTIDFTINLNV